jgi:predicted GNAT family N-acyltransferase
MKYSELMESTLETSIIAVYPGVKLDLHDGPSKISISRIVVPKESRNSGVGTSVMLSIIKYADANNKTVTLTPASDFGGAVSRLKTFYKRFGFVENKGRNKDYEISDSMYRVPE